MDLIRHIVLFCHLIGFALLLGAATAQYLTGKLRINAPMLWGAIIQVISGVLLATPLGHSSRVHPSPVALAIKLVVALCVLAMTFFPREREKVNRGHFIAIAVLVLGNAVIGVFWL